MEDITRRAAERIGISEEQMHHIVSDLFRVTKTHLQNPDTVKHGVFLNGFVKFKLVFDKIKYYLKNRKEGNTTNAKNTIEYWEQILENKEKYGNH